MVGDYFVRLANEVESPITNLKLQKLVYYAQAWSLALRAESLFDEDFEAWVHGPVVRSLYDEYKAFRWTPIVKDVQAPALPDSLLDHLREVAEIYFACDAYELERMTHAELPWIEARRGIPPNEHCENIISKDSMAKFYAERATAH